MLTITRVTRTRSGQKWIIVATYVLGLLKTHFSVSTDFKCFAHFVDDEFFSTTRFRRPLLCRYFHGTCLAELQSFVSPVQTFTIRRDYAAYTESTHPHTPDLVKRKFYSKVFPRTVALWNGLPRRCSIDHYVGIQKALISLTVWSGVTKLSVTWSRENKVVVIS